VYDTRTDLDELKERLRTEWAKLENVVIAAVIRQWRRRLSACVKVVVVLVDILTFEQCL